MLSPPNRALATGLILSLIGGAFAYGIFWLERSNSFEHNKTSVTFAQAIDQDVVLQAIEISGAEAVGDPVKVQERQMMSYIRLRDKHSKTEDSQVELFFCCKSDALDDSLHDLATNGTIGGMFAGVQARNAPPFPWRESLEATFPELAEKRIALLDAPPAPPKYKASWMVGGLGLLGIPFSFLHWWILRRREQSWIEKQANFRFPDIRDYPLAFRLVGNESNEHKLQGPLRSIDRNFDVPEENKKGRHFSPQGMWLTAFLGVPIFLAFGVYLIKTCDACLNMEVRAAADVGFGLAIASALLTGIAQVYAMRVGRRHRVEKSLDASKSNFSISGFHTLHRNILEQLDFHQIGTFKQKSISHGPTRTIYVSSRGNLLVEIGRLACRDYFAIKTMLNDGCLVETNSFPNKREMKDGMRREKHVYRIVKSDNLFEALGSHDRLINELTFGSSALETEFTDENWSRFVHWPLSKYELDDDLRR